MDNELKLTKPKRSEIMGYYRGCMTKKRYSWKVWVDGYSGYLETYQLRPKQPWSVTGYTGHEAVCVGYGDDMLDAAKLLVEWCKDRRHNKFSSNFFVACHVSKMLLNEKYNDDIADKVDIVLSDADVVCNCRGLYPSNCRCYHHQIRNEMGYPDKTLTELIAMKVVEIGG